MRVLAFDCRCAGPRSYENALIDLAAVVMDGSGEELGSYHEFVKPDKYRSYRLDTLVKAGEDFGTLSAKGIDFLDAVSGLCEFLSSHQGGAPVWVFDLREVGDFLESGLRLTHRQLDGMTDVCSLWMVARSLGVRNEEGGRVPGIGSTLGLLSYLGYEVTDWDATPALERAKVAASVAGRIIEKIKVHARGKGAMDVEPEPPGEAPDKKALPEIRRMVS